MNVLAPVHMRHDGRPATHGTDIGSSPNSFRLSASLGYLCVIALVVVSDLNGHEIPLS
jgi:hypothetical protein